MQTEIRHMNDFNLFLLIKKHDRCLFFLNLDADVIRLLVNDGIRAYEEALEEAEEEREYLYGYQRCFLKLNSDSHLKSLLVSGSDASDADRHRMLCQHFCHEFVIASNIMGINHASYLHRTTTEEPGNRIVQAYLEATSRELDVRGCKLIFNVDISNIKNDSQISTDSLKGLLFELSKYTLDGNSIVFLVSGIDEQELNTLYQDSAFPLNAVQIKLLSQESFI